MGEKHIIRNKNIKLFALFLIVLSIICTLSCVSARDYDSNSSEIISDPATGDLFEIYVSYDGSDKIGDGSSQNPFQSLEYAFANSKNGSTIYLNDGEYGQNNRNIKIDKTITIIGKSKENAIINGESSDRLFNVTPASRLTLINITFINAYTTENGGSIYCNGGEINIKNCIFKNSRADANGGVIYNNLGSLNIEDTCFTNNSASDYGGVLYTLGTTTIKNSNFTDNILTSKSAGIGACIATGGKIDLDGCLFRDCYTPYSAGGIINLGNATVNNCRFERLNSNYTAGAISNHKYMLINNSYFMDNYAQYYAAAILEYAGEELSTAPGGPYVITDVYNTVFERNHANFHGAISNNFRNTYLHIENCAIIDNYIGKLNEAYGDVSLDDNATMQYCWWGKNEINPYYYSRYNKVNQPEKINASRWLIMTFASKDNAIYKEENNQLTVSLRQYFDNETKGIQEYNGEFNIPLEVTLYTDSGILATKKLVNGVATFDFNPKDETSAVYAKVNNQILKIDNFQLRKTSVIVNNIEKYYGSGGKLSVKLVKENNVPISNGQLTVSLAGSTYTVKTDKNGIAKLALKNNPKKYAVKITFNGKNYIKSSKSATVKIVKPIITVSKLKIHKKGKLTVTFKDANKKAIKNTKVTFKIKGKTYIRTTNSKGQAKLTMNFKVGTYAVKVGFESTSYYGTTTLTKKIKLIK